MRTSLFIAATLAAVLPELSTAVPINVDAEIEVEADTEA